MTIQRMIELLQIEHECMLRGAHDDCERNCSDCELVQDDGDLHEMYTDVIALLKDKEPVEPISRFNKLLNETIYWCGKCEAHIEKNQSYCGCCGRSVKWNV